MKKRHFFAIMALHHPPFPCKIKTECKKLLLCFVFGWLAIVYITFKPYPMDYVDGKLLVDPQRMMVDGYGDIALLIAFPAARYIEKRWIRFEATGVKAKGIVICSVGMIFLWAMLTFLGDPLDDMLGRCWWPSRQHDSDCFLLHCDLPAHHPA